MKNSAELTTEIDKDEGLKSKRKLLIIASCILLALSFSGATIDEANTFIFKIKFTNQNGLGILLVLSIVFLMIRYYNYAVVYHTKLYELWSERLLKHPDILGVCPHSDEFYGLISSHMPLKADDVRQLSYENDNFKYDWSYKCTFPFRRFVIFQWLGRHDINEESLNIGRSLGFRVYAKFLWLEAQEQVSSFFTYRENLDILTPYALGFFSIASYYFNTEMMLMLQFITPSKND
ncbi:hypothetical protein O1C60_003518 [Vibrio cholerae]|nr:hypothetical protein [Vibrio cholerae]EKF9648361.1 hypothetical protein [Vibrio cholerae]EKF9652173.1 hypothetical protein [Vibrio cholerae]